MTRYSEGVERQKLVGSFAVEPDRMVHGELTIDGAKTSLYLQDKKFFRVHDERDMGLTGVLRDHTKVSLMSVIARVTSGSAHTQDGGYSYAEVFPHFVLLGTQHIEPQDAVVKSISFIIDDASVVFNDTDVFGHLFKTEGIIEQILERASEGRGKRKFEIGPYPDIYFYTGKQNVFSAETIIGTISAANVVGPTFPSVSGISVQNSIFTTITFPKSVVFKEAIISTIVLQNFLGMMAGRPQNLLRVSIEVESEDDELPCILDVHWSMPISRKLDSEQRRAHRFDLLFDVAKEPEEFERVVTNWFDRQPTWRNARERFFGSFSDQNSYGYDRLIGSANMFDLLPATALPASKEISAELTEAVTASKILFKRLPESLERSSILSELARAGQSKLKEKIRHRAKTLIDRLGHEFPEMTLVTDEAVNCRNHYVHGGATKIDYSSNFAMLVFLTNTLEFVFAASDLIEAGWRIEKWGERGTSGSHPFAGYRYSYNQNLKELKRLMQQ